MVNGTGKSETPPETRGWLGVPDALWNTIIGAIVTIILSFMAQRNHTATLDNTEAVKKVAAEAKNAAVDARTAVKENTEAIQKTADAISTLPDDAAKKVVERVSENK